MNISFEQLKSMVVFAQVIEQGSLSAAARHIGLSRAVVSYHLKKEHDELSESNKYDIFFLERIILMSWKTSGGSTVITIQNPLLS